MRGLLSNTVWLGFYAALSCVAVSCGAAPAPVVLEQVPTTAPSATSTATAPADVTAPKVGSCSSDDPYQPTPASSGRAPQLPDVPTILQAPVKVGDAFTVFGATHALRSRFGSAEVTRGDIAIIGYVVDENMKTAPACAIHKTGKADPEGCAAPPIPTFVIADAKDATTGIKVMGWARNYAILFDANALYAKGKPAQPLIDDVIQVEVPYPLPAVGAKVKVTGTLSFAFTRLSTGMVTDPQNGILTYHRMEVLEPAPKPAKLGK